MKKIYFFKIPRATAIYILYLLYLGGNPVSKPTCDVLVFYLYLLPLVFYLYLLLLVDPGQLVQLQLQTQGALEDLVNSHETKIIKVEKTVFLG